MKSRNILSALLIALGLTLAGCAEDQGPAEEAGENIDESMERAGDEIEGATDEMGDTLEEAGDNMEQSTDN
ncbi:hypothetical protein [Thiohalobacter thiocyanaticus]|uniref:Uncharacterized protein n=1 Tax=Thiohalobacter thiocyanaticus TaxID=585455 RepID=A0A426QGG8_9GAMM|nr:hypothetical protein [Thiohalobacter thiocyanaticus]RRQ20849.1 hypothetical protein D6C00_01940 [Thiohalobacter thiocyanaticus]